MKHRTLTTVMALSVIALLAVEAGDAWARARGGGSRGSRSYSAPAAPSSPGKTSPSPQSPALSRETPSPAATAPQRRGFFGGFGGALAGFALGGLLGGMLFGGFGHGFGGIGLMDIIIVGGLAFLAWQFFRRRREAQEPAYATTAGSSRYGATATASASGGATSGGSTVIGAQPQSAPDDLQRGVAHIRQMDPGFDPVALADWSRTLFASVQSAVGMRDMGILRDRLTPEMYNVLQEQCRELKVSHRTGYTEKLELERAETTEMWQEGGYDFVTVYFAGSMIDYTADDRTGEVVAGSKTEPQAFEEFWTFTRPVGPNKWKLSAIQSA